MNIPADKSDLSDPHEPAHHGEPLEEYMEDVDLSANPAPEQPPLPQSAPAYYEDAGDYQCFQ